MTLLDMNGVLQKYTALECDLDAVLFVEEMNHNFREL